MKILTISIAAYNVESYLRGTLNSLADERLMDDLEVLIVDDGSKDGTEEIARQYELKYPKIFRYIKKVNGGHGSTINKGLELAMGKYFRVVDGDDSVITDHLVELINWMKQYDEDMFISDYRCITSKGRQYRDSLAMVNGVSVYDKFVDNKVYTIDDTIEHASLFTIHSVAIKTDVLRQMRFTITEHCFYVDMEFVVWCMSLANQFRYFSKPVYLYYKDQEDAGNSVAKKNMIKNIAMQEKVSRTLIKIFQQLAIDNKLDGKKNIILKKITAVIAATMRTYLLMDNTLTRVKEFDTYIKKESSAVYLMLDNNTFIHCSRFCSYLLLPLIKLAYRFFVKYKYNY